MNYTKNYQLNQWDAGDRVLREDFNADNRKIEEALADKSSLVFGSYTGNSASSQEINLGFAPRAVLVCDKSGLMATGTDSFATTYGGMAQADKPADVGGCICLKATDTGFTVYNYPDFDNIRTNRTGRTYYYLALR